MTRRHRVGMLQERRRHAVWQLAAFVEEVCQQLAEHLTAWRLTSVPEPSSAPQIGRS